MAEKIKTTFSGNKVTIGCVLYLFSTMGFCSIYQAGMALFPETYNVTVTQASSAMSALALFAFLSSLIYTAVNGKIGAKGMMYLGAVLTLATAVCLSFLSGFIGLVIAFAFYGAINGFATFTLVTEIVNNWFITKRADRIGLVIGSHAFGMSAYQFVAGRMFDAIGLRTGFIAIGIFNCVLLVIVARFFVVAGKPEDVGEKPLGYELSTETVAVEAVESDDSSSNLYKTPTFWLGCVARFIGAAGVMFVPTYATLYFQQGGMDLTASSTLISIMTLASAFFQLVAGRIISVVKAKGFVVLVMLLSAGTNIAMLIYGKMPSLIVIVVLVLCYSAGNSWSSVLNFVADKMFAPTDVNNAISKLMALHYAGNICYLPFCGFLLERSGYDVLWIFLTIMSIVSLAFYMISMSVAKKTLK